MSDTTSGLDQPTGSATGLQRLARASWRSMLQVALLVLALSVLVRTVAGLDIDETTSELTDAWPLVGLAFITAQAPRLTQRNHLAPPGELLVDASRKVPEGGLVP